MPLVPAFSTPGLAANLLWDRAAAGMCEYAVSAVHGKGEGPMSAAVDSDPTSQRRPTIPRIMLA